MTYPAHTYADEPFSRPSHPSPSTALHHPDRFPSSQQHRVPPGRPSLRIITQPASFQARFARPLPVRHPGLVKSAPLYAALIPITHSPPEDQIYCQFHHEYNCSPTMIVHESSLLQPNPDSRRVSAGETDRKGHKRRFSDRFKHIVAALHLKKGSRTPSTQTSSYDDSSEMTNNDTAVPGDTLPAPPARPYRSPGTASFLVTRHLHGASTPASTRSSHSSVTAVTLARRRPFVDKRELLAPPGIDISHFSDLARLKVLWMGVDGLSAVERYSTKALLVVKRSNSMRA
jgi:hypothetical protein